MCDNTLVHDLMISNILKVSFYGILNLCRELISRSSTSVNDLIIVSSLHASRACFLSYLVIGLTQSQNPELVLRIYIYKQKRDWGQLGRQRI